MYNYRKHTRLLQDSSPELKKIFNNKASIDDFDQWFDELPMYVGISCHEIIKQQPFTYYYFLEKLSDDHIKVWFSTLNRDMVSNREFDGHSVKLKIYDLNSISDTRSFFQTYRRLILKTGMIHKTRNDWHKFLKFNENGYNVAYGFYVRNHLVIKM